MFGRAISKAQTSPKLEKEPAFGRRLFLFRLCFLEKIELANYDEKGGLLFHYGGVIEGHRL